MMSQGPRRSHFIAVAVDVLQILARPGVAGVAAVGREEKNKILLPCFSLYLSDRTLIKRRRRKAHRKSPEFTAGSCPFPLTGG